MAGIQWIYVSRIWKNGDPAERDRYIARCPDV